MNKNNENTIHEVKEKVDHLIAEVQKVIVGKQQIIELMLVALFSGGHLLFEDVPGVGKTLLVKALAKTIQGEFSRVQFTPDLLPGDILGFSFYNTKTKKFEFRPGPIFTTILLADEINRTTPRTQAALLEAMAEKHITIDNQTYPLDNHFFVLATQNSIEYEGTYPLPEAQLDRFLFRLHIGYPSFEEELSLLLETQEQSLATLKVIFTKETLTSIKQIVSTTYLDPSVARYALELVTATRNHPAIKLGISPRGSLAFIQAAKSHAVIKGRTYVAPIDFQVLLPFVFKHRLLFHDRSLTDEEIELLLTEMLKQIPIPVK